MSMTDHRKRFPAMAALIVFWSVMTGLAIFAAFCGRESWTMIRVMSMCTVISAALSIFYLNCVPEKEKTNQYLSIVLTIPAIWACVVAMGVLIYSWLAWEPPSCRALYTAFQAYFVVNLVGIPWRIALED